MTLPCVSEDDFTEIWNDLKRTVSYEVLTKSIDPMTGDETSSFTSGFTATGGTITDVSGDKVHTFTSSGTFTTTADIPNCEILIIGGGGAGGDRNDEGGGGGGSGGAVHGTGITIATGSHTIVVGLGGTPVDNLQGNNGQDTSYDSIIAKGGGGGGSSSVNPQNYGKDGGSGGGTGPQYNDPGVPYYSNSTQGSFVGYTSYGNKGGSHTDKVNYGSGGGGGIGQVGGNPIGTAGGNGGDGLQFNISGTNIYYGGGGGGAYLGQGLGGLGGGGNGDTNSLDNGSAGTNGLGAGGGGGSGGSSIGYAGGSGIVIIRYTPVSVSRDVIFFKENERWLFDKEGLTEVGDGYIMAPISDNIKRYDRFTIDNETYYIEAVYRRYVAQTAMHDFAVCFLVDK